MAAPKLKTISPTLSRPLLRPRILRILALTPQARSATSNASASRRRAVTVVNDTGHVPWKELRPGEKAARATQQTFNVGLILLGIAMTGGVATVLWLEVFSTDSKTSIFNQAADRVRKDEACRKLLAGDELSTKRDIKAYGEPSWSRWARNRTIASRIEKDRAGNEVLFMHFYVEGPVEKGTVRVEMVRRQGDKQWDYRLLALDVPGRPRHFLENPSANARKAGRGNRGTMFGVRWS